MRPTALYGNSVAFVFSAYVRGSMIRLQTVPRGVAQLIPSFRVGLILQARRYLLPDNLRVPQKWSLEELPYAAVVQVCASQVRHSIRHRDEFRSALTKASVMDARICMSAARPCQLVNPT